MYSFSVHNKNDYCFPLAFGSLSEAGEMIQKLPELASINKARETRINLYENQDFIVEIYSGTLSLRYPLPESSKKEKRGWIVNCRSSYGAAIELNPIVWTTVSPKQYRLQARSCQTTFKFVHITACKAHVSGTAQFLPDGFYLSQPLACTKILLSHLELIMQLYVVDVFGFETASWLVPDHLIEEFCQILQELELPYKKGTPTWNIQD